MPRTMIRPVAKATMPRGGRIGRGAAWTTTDRCGAGIGRIGRWRDDGSVPTRGPRIGIGARRVYSGAGASSPWRWWRRCRPLLPGRGAAPHRRIGGGAADPTPPRRGEGGARATTTTTTTRRRSGGSSPGTTTRCTRRRRGAYWRRRPSWFWRLLGAGFGYFFKGSREGAFVLAPPKRPPKTIL